MGSLTFDIPFIINTIFVAAVGSFFGSIVGVWVSHHYQKKRDDITWERDKDKLKAQFAHDMELAQVQFQYKLNELEQQFRQQQSIQLRNEIMRDVNNPEAVIQAIEKVQHIVDELKGRSPSEIRVLTSKRN